MCPPCNHVISAYSFYIKYLNYSLYKSKSCNIKLISVLKLCSFTLYCYIIINLPICMILQKIASMLKFYLTEFNAITTSNWQMIYIHKEGGVILHFWSIFCQHIVTFGLFMLVCSCWRYSLVKKHTCFNILYVS